jgi:chloramphenicol-sensitive protein RarD
MPDQLKRGYVHGLIAYGAWGVIPIYFWVLSKYATAEEILAHRIVWSAIMLSLVLALLGQWPELLRVIRRPRSCLGLIFSSLLIGLNWYVYIYGVKTNRIVYCSLGYFITPLVSVALGVFLLGEKVRNWQLVALACAVVGLAILMTGADEFPWISLSLAATFSTYGLIRKLTTAEALVGLSAETFFLTPLALWYVLTQSDAWPRADVGGQIALVLSGPATVIPLYCFARAARLLPLSVLGFLQYISPSLQFLVGALLFQEQLDALKLSAFGFVWLGLVIFSWDAWRRFTQTPAAGIETSLVPTEKP